MASRGYKVQPLPRIPRHDTVQVLRAYFTFFINVSEPLVKKFRSARTVTWSGVNKVLYQQAAVYFFYSNF